MSEAKTCEQCAEAPATVVVDCVCCEGHGRRRYRVCAECREWVRRRFTCPWHGDCC